MNTARISVYLVPFALVVACSSASGTGIMTETMPTAPVDGGAPKAAVDASKPAADPPKKDAAPVDPPTLGECSSETTQSGCITCCSNKHADGSGTYFVALIDCMCLPANCAKDCAKTLCDPMSPQNADAQCQSCVQAKNSACAPSITTACAADPDCGLFDVCISKSNCSDK